MTVRLASTVRSAIVAVFGALLTVAAITAWALESGGVAVIHTRSPDGSRRATHVWTVQHEGELWVEAGTPENAWFRDVQRTPDVEIEVDGMTLLRRAERIEAPAAHDRIRALLREKYGVRDWWVGWFVDTSRSIAVRLVPTQAKAP